MDNHPPGFHHHLHEVCFLSLPLSAWAAGLYICYSSLGSTIFAPSVPTIMEEFHSNNGALSGLVVSVFVIGFCFGPLVLAPMSELYGRNPVYHGSNICFTIFSVACAVSTSLPMLIAFRFLMGLSGCPSLSLGGGTIADLIPLNERGAALSIWALGPLLVCACLVHAGKA